MCPHGHQQIGCAAICTLGHTMFGYTYCLCARTKESITFYKGVDSKMVDDGSRCIKYAQEVVRIMSELKVCHQETQCALPVITTMAM